MEDLTHALNLVSLNTGKDTTARQISAYLPLTRRPLQTGRQNNLEGPQQKPWQRSLHHIDEDQRQSSLRGPWTDQSESDDTRLELLP